MPDGAPPPPRLWDPRWRLLLVGVVCLVTVVALEAMAITTVMPLVERDLGDLWLYGWAFSAFYLGGLVGIVLGGRAADRMAPVLPLMAGLVVFGAGLVAGGAAPTMAVLVLGRLLQGVGAGAVPTVAYVCVGRGFPAELRPRVFAVMSTAWIVPSLVSPLAASAVARGVGWRWVFLGLVPVTAAVGLLAARVLRGIGAPAAHGAGATPVGAALALAAGAAVALGGLTAEHWWALPLVAVGLATVVPAFRRLTPPGTLAARRGLPAAVLTRGVLTFGFFSANAFISLALVSVRGTSTFFAGAVLAVASLTWTAGAWLQARLGVRVGARPLVGGGGLVLAVGLAGLAVGLVGAVPLGVWALASGVAGLGMGMAYPSLSVVTLAEAEPGREGRATSALQLTDVLGTALGTGVAGVVVSVGDRSDAEPWVALAVVFGVATCAALAVVVLSSRLSASRSPTTPHPAL